jgi:hypothetical protein
MAAGDDVQVIYKALLADGKTPKDAAKEAQKRTGMSVVTNAPIKPKGLTFTKEGIRYGQNTQLKRQGSSQKQKVPRQFG